MATPKPVEIKPAGRPDWLSTASAVGSSRIFLSFEDGLQGTWSFTELGLDMSGMALATIKADGTAVAVKSKRNDDVKIDAASLRASVDPNYKNELEKALLALRGPLDNL